MMRVIPIATLAGLVACAPASDATPPARVGSLPKTHAECVASGGEVEPVERGGRCFTYFSSRADASGYAHCRSAGGVSGVRGPGRSREASGRSHVCTLVFEPDP